jgi:hypothetical protein
MKKVLAIKLVVFFLFFASPVLAVQGDQTLEVCIRLDTSKQPITSVHDGIKEKCKKFGMLPHVTDTERYISVSSVYYKDYLDEYGCVQFTKNFMKNIPYTIQKNILQGSEVVQEKEIRILEKEYLFPKYIPQSFIDNIGHGFSHKLYEKDGSCLTIRYVLEEKTDNKPSLEVTKEVRRNNNYPIFSIFDSVGLSELGLVTFWLLFLGHK